MFGISGKQIEALNPSKPASNPIKSQLNTGKSFPTSQKALSALYFPVEKALRCARNAPGAVGSASHLAYIVS